MSDFRMSRVCALKPNITSLDGDEAEYEELTARQFMFRMHALAGNLPGVKKASW